MLAICTIGAWYPSTGRFAIGERVPVGAGDMPADIARIAEALDRERVEV